MHQVSVWNLESYEREQKKIEMLLFFAFLANNMFLQVQKNGDSLKEIYGSS